jgi:hypothetical protein
MILLSLKMSTFGIHRLDWLMVSKRFPWNAKYETVYRWLASFIVIYTIMDLKSETVLKISYVAEIVKSFLSSEFLSFSPQTDT